jgi:DNA-binding transcriptional ArsR family regulator
MGASACASIWLREKIFPRRFAACGSPATVSAPLEAAEESASGSSAGCGHGAPLGAPAPAPGTRPLEVPTKEGWDARTGEPLRLAERFPVPLDTELAVEAREALRALARLRWRRRRALELKLAGFDYREIMELFGVTYSNVNRHLSEGTELREAA